MKILVWPLFFVAALAGMGVYLLRGESATVDATAGYGTDPVLPGPNARLVPTVNIAPAVGRPHGMVPAAVYGFSTNAFATGLDHPRWLHVLPNGDVLVVPLLAGLLD